MIKSVKGIRIGDKYVYAGEVYIVDNFPTRSMVVLKADTPKSGFPSMMKESIKTLQKVNVFIELHNGNRERS